MNFYLVNIGYVCRDNPEEVGSKNYIIPSDSLINVTIDADERFGEENIFNIEITPLDEGCNGIIELSDELSQMVKCDGGLAG